jgi:hypothetical protein
MLKSKRRLIIGLVVLLVSLAFAGGVSASEGHAPLLDDEVVFFGTYTLDSGETLNGSLIVFGGVVSLEEDSTVTGDVIIFGGNVTASGRSKGNLVAIGGVVDLTGTAIVEGDLIAPATVVRRDEGARIYGQIITENIPEIDAPELPEAPEAPVPPSVPDKPDFIDRVSTGLQPVIRFFATIARALVFSAVAVLVGLVLPRHSQVVRETIADQPVLSGGFGLLSVAVFIAVVIVLALLSITVILIPITVASIVLLSLALVLGLMFGLMAVGADVGRRMMVALKQEWTPMLQMALGNFSLTFILGLLSIGLWGFLGGLLWTVVGAVGLGAVLLTRFGTQDYVPASQRQVSVPIDEGEISADSTALESKTDTSVEE